jgi:hypothetical protein
MEGVLFMRDLFETIIENEEMIARKKRRVSQKKKNPDRLSLVEALGGRRNDESFFDLDHAVASRATSDDLEWTTGWSGEDEISGDSEEF